MTRFRRLCLITCIAVILLIGVGGVVRSTGAGMGCPDWPTCFGQWIPPIYEHQLPDNYQVIYADHGYGTATFNPVKTWTEYVNRLLGVLIGFLILGTGIASLRLWATHKWITILSVLNILLVGLQGGLGALVVYSNLHPLMITLHMLLALIILFILVITYLASDERPAPTPITWMKPLAIGLFVVTLIQILLGTQVREMIDIIASQSHFTLRETWVAKIGTIYLIHRTFSWIPLLLVFVGLYYLRNTENKHPVKKGWSWIFSLILLEILAGVAMAYGNMPMFIQPLHLVLASVLFVVEVKLLYDLRSCE